ncbi:hypothetical protein VKT23_010417 [Stygiomarasmius scandens]|uniref:F-box domain-containing protein n=1 Tax=Marasmiellus scandens TaxID=2682957 RepID=A0ABR1JEZ0_9AGAR
MSCQQTQLFQPRVTQFDVESLLNSIRSSTSDVEPDLRHAISEAEKDIFDYEKIIEDLEKLVLSMKGKRDQLKQYTRDCRHRLPALILERLPPEILAAIFLFYQDVQNTGKDGPFREPIADPEPLPLSKWGSTSKGLTTLTLGSVCSRWRNACISTPRLWSRFSIALVANDRDAQHVHDILNLYLSRSERHPLFFDIVINDDPADGGRRIQDHTPNLQLLVDNCYRWCSTSWKITCPNLSTKALLSARKDLPLLRGLQIKETPGNDGPTIFSGAPALSCMGLGSQDTALLSTLSLDGPSWIELYGIITTLTLPSLKNLSLSDKGSSGSFPESDTFGAAFSSFLSRSKCTITTFKFTDLHSRTGLTSVLDMLQQVPTITELTLSERREESWPNQHHLPNVMTDLTQLLRAPETDGRVALPNLRKLRVEVDWNNKKFHHLRFLDLVASRSTCQCTELERLESLTIVLRCRSPDYTTHYVGGLLEEDMQSKLPGLSKSEVLVGLYDA